MSVSPEQLARDIAAHRLVLGSSRDPKQRERVNRRLAKLEARLSEIVERDAIRRRAVAAYRKIAAGHYPGVSMAEAPQ